MRRCVAIRMSCGRAAVGRAQMSGGGWRMVHSGNQELEWSGSLPLVATFLSEPSCLQKNGTGKGTGLPAMAHSSAHRTARTAERGGIELFGGFQILRQNLFSLGESLIVQPALWGRNS